MEASVKGLGSLATSFLWLGMPVTTAYIAITSPTTASLLPVIMLPTIWSPYKRRCLPLEHRAKLETLAYNFWTVGSLGIFGVIVLQSLGSSGIARLLFGSAREAKAYMQGFSAPKWLRDGSTFALLAIFTYVKAGGLEELLKYAPIAYMRRKVSKSGSRIVVAKLYIQYALAAALGFSTLENVGMTMGALKSGEGAVKTALAVF
ncbi:hypothetical protein LTR36_008276 [Oleoguttula mirabilis]|uniref:Uncharacterized protein n=1 Tax=Oleoguttula mirabilis TaxID=1507867 RepID=A0AAV9J810_9PEZI|nr:hypothetical protein LTR36_008276 [Oleoguttula mirabilis]